MKAKRILTVGLAAVMAMGMSISAFAAGFDYSDVPQFGGENGVGEWDAATPYDTNIFNANGKGWLESSEGINESAANVMVPTMPAIDIRYGQPGLFDFGLDPQRLVDRTEALKYQDKENFTQSALKNGVYFINGPLGDSILNTYDNKSVKLKGTNLGTEPVGFKVTATLKDGVGIKYLDKVPVNVNTAAKDFDDIWDTYGDNWYTFVTTHGPNQDTMYYSEEALADRSKLQFAIDLGELFSLENHLPYHFYYEGNNQDDGVYSTAEFETLMQSANTKSYLKDGAVEPTIAIEMLQTVTALQTVQNDDQFLAALEDYKGTDVVDDYELSDSTDIGMYLGLNTALGTTKFVDVNYEGTYVAETGASAQEVEKVTIDKTPIKKATDTATTATATGHVKVNGSSNYVITYSPEQKKYIYTLKEGDLVFNTVAFWFEGVATANKLVPTNTIAPTLDFTWTFSQTDFPEVPAPDPLLEKVNGVNVGNEFDGRLTEANADGDIVLTFNVPVYSIDYIYGSEGGIDLWKTVNNTSAYDIEGNVVTLHYDYWMEQTHADRVIRVVFTQGYDEPQRLGNYTLVYQPD